MQRTVIQNNDRAERVIAFLEKLPITEGKLIGQSQKLDEWQRAFIYDTFAPEYEDNGDRVVRQAGLTVARKNGKTFLIAGLILCALVGCISQPNGQLYSVANDKEQAAVLFKMCRDMVDLRPSLKELITVYPGTKRLVVKRSDIQGRGSFYASLSSEAATKHGYGPSFFVFDEYSEAPLTDELYQTMFDGMANRDNPVAIVISTQNPDPQHPLSQMIDDAQSGEDPSKIFHVHAADPGCDLMDREQWIKANPALKTWKKWDQIEKAAAEAVRLRSKEQGFRRRYLNQRVSQYSSLINRADWKDCEAEYDFEPGEPIYLGLDMADTGHDLCALVAVSALNGSRVKAWFWKPDDHLEEHTKRDQFRYDLYADQGLLETCRGRLIDPRDVASKIAELSQTYDVRGVAYDRWRIENVLRHFDDIGLEVHIDKTGKTPGRGLRLVPWGMGDKDMGPAIDAFEAAIIAGELKQPNHPILTWNVANAIVHTNKAGDRSFDKGKVRFRIDGIVALTIALGLKYRDRAPTPPKNPWEDEGFTMTVL